MIQRVAQLHDNGCFVGSVAMLLGICYEEAFERIYPGRIMPAPGIEDASFNMMIDEALAVMPRLGLQLKWSGLHSARSLRKRTSLVILRWWDFPWLSHALVFDGERSVFVDPSFKIPPNYKILKKNLFGIYYVKKVPHELPIRNTDICGHESAGGLSEPRCLPGSQETPGNALILAPNITWEDSGDRGVQPVPPAEASSTLQLPRVDPGLL